MTTIFKSTFISLICFITSALIITSCKKTDNNVNAGRAELLSFGPTGAKPGDTLRFIGNNLNKVTEIDLTGAVVPQSSFIQQNPELILIIVPQETQPGIVMLKTTDGDLVSKTSLNLNVTPTVTLITPEARPGENITISGQYLNWVTQITFANDKSVDSNAFVSKAMDKLVVTIPADAQTGPLLIAYGGTEPMQIQSDDTLKVTLPAFTSISPNPVKHQTNLTITGTNLDLAKQVVFTGVTDPVTTFVSQSPTQIVVQVPASAQPGKISLVANSGVAVQSSEDLNVLLPTIATMAPNPVDPGANLTITGTNLDLVTSVTFENAPAVTTFVSQSATAIIVTVPAGVLKGKIKLTVLNSTLTVQSADALEIIGSLPPPAIAFPIYNDALTTNWTNTGGWAGTGWGGTKDYNNTSPVREGSKSVKISYEGGYGSPMQLGHNAGDSLIISSYTTFKISIYGAPGSGGKKVNIGINGTDKYTITLVEGTWTDYAVPLSTLTSGNYIKEIVLKEYNGTGGFTIYVDDIGLN